MPEALAVVAVFVIAIVIYFAMWMQSRDPALNKPHEELARLQHQVKWLEDRLARARHEQWGDHMIAPIADEYAAAVQQLAQATAIIVPATAAPATAASSVGAGQ